MGRKKKIIKEDVNPVYEAEMNKKKFLLDCVEKRKIAVPKLKEKIKSIPELYWYSPTLIGGNKLPYIPVVIEFWEPYLVLVATKYQLNYLYSHYVPDVPLCQMFCGDTFSYNAYLKKEDGGRDFRWVITHTIEM